MFSIEVNETFERIIKIFHQFGYWHIDDETTLTKKVVTKLFYTFSGALFPIFFVINSIFCADRSESIFSIQTAIITSVIYIKFLYLLYKKPEILALLSDTSVVHSIEIRTEFEQTNKKIRKFVKFVRLYCLAIFVSLALVVLIKLPIFTADKGLPLFISFSWNDSEIIYWLAYFFVSLSSLLFVVANLITPLIWYMILSYSIEIELLGKGLVNLCGSGTKTLYDKDRKSVKKELENRVKEQNNVRLTQRSLYVENLIVFIKAHRNLTKKVERFRSLFATLFLGQITTSSIGICASVYNLAFVTDQNILQSELYVMVLLYGIFDIFLVLYLTNDISVASDRLSYCLFESNWMEQTESCKKYVLIMGEILKQPLQLFIFIYPMNLETFTKIINTAYSMFNILKSFK